MRHFLSSHPKANSSRNLLSATETSYQSITWYNVIKKNGPDTASNGATYLYIVKHKYRAKNAFGGYMIDDDYFYLDAQGNVVDWVNNPG